MNSTNTLVSVICEFVKHSDVIKWLNCKNDTEEAKKELLNVIAATKNAEVSYSRAMEERGELQKRIIWQEALSASKGTLSNSHTRNVRVFFRWNGDEVWPATCLDNSFKGTFRRIINGNTVKDDILVMLFCKCLELSMENNEVIAEHLKSTIEGATGLKTTNNIANDLFYCYNGGILPKKECIDSISEKQKGTEQIETRDPFDLFCQNLWSEAPHSTWSFHAAFVNAYKKLIDSSYKHALVKYKLAKAIADEAKKHPVFDLMFSDTQNITLYKDEIVSLLKVSTAYDKKLIVNDDPFSGIIVLSPYGSFYKAMIKEQADVFSKLSDSYNQYNLIITLGELARQAMEGTHEFKLEIEDSLGSIKSERYRDIYNDTLNKKDNIFKDIANGKIRWIVPSGSKGQKKWRFLTAQHRLFFLASLDVLKHSAGELNDEALIDLLLAKITSYDTGSHLSRKHQSFLCYAYFLFSLLSIKSIDLVNELMEYADDFSIENGHRNRQMAVLMLFSMLISENYPATGGMLKELIDHSYGRAVYDYQLLVLESIKNSNPQHVEYIKNKIFESLRLTADNANSVADPYFLLAASKLGEDILTMNEAEVDAYGGKYAVEFFYECLRLHGETWPSKENPEKLRKILKDIITALTTAREYFENPPKSSLSTYPVYVFGANLLFYSLSNISRANFQAAQSEIFTNNDYLSIYKTLIYTDYYTRELSKGYNALNTPKDFYLLCGPYRFVCAVRHETDKPLKIDLDQDKRNRYVEWYEREKKMAEGGSKRYLLLLTRLLSYTDFFDHYKKLPTFEDCATTEFLEYDNMPNLSAGGKKIFEDFMDDPRKLWRKQS